MTDLADDLRVVDNPGESRYEARLGDKVVGWSEYELDGSRINFTHTEVDPAFEGRGFGSRLAAGALDHVRTRGLAVVADCRFIGSYLRRHREYDDLRVAGAEPVAVEDVVYDGDVAAWLVRPVARGSGRFAGIVMWHWLSTEDPVGTRDEFLDEARGLAARGAVCLLPQGRFPWSIAPSGSASDAAEIEGEVRRLSRGLDLLAGRDDVDGTRLAIVGHDFGAMLGMIAAAREPRIRAAALIAPTPRWGDWVLPFWPIEEDRIEYLSALRPLDPVEQMGAIAPRPVLLQMARRDFYVPLMAGFELRAASGQPRGDKGPLVLRAYDAEHDLEVDDAVGDRAVFLARELDVRGDAVGPVAG
jgi:predicted GNAT family acetyltransferase/dienelactone hydrolase